MAECEAAGAVRSMQDKLLNQSSNTVAALRGSSWCHLSICGQVFGKKRFSFSIDWSSSVFTQPDSWPEFRCDANGTPQRGPASPSGNRSDRRDLILLQVSVPNAC
jgi:hypothetical protein